MNTYEVMLGVDRAARDTGRRITMRVYGSDPVSVAIKAEKMADAGLKDPGVEYTHAMRVRPVGQPAQAAVALALAA
jgi:hypothetical protein